MNAHKNHTTAQNGKGIREATICNPFDAGVLRTPMYEKPKEAQIIAFPSITIPRGPYTVGRVSRNCRRVVHNHFGDLKPRNDLRRGATFDIGGSPILA
jgi:hypothetical protein